MVKVQIEVRELPTKYVSASGASNTIHLERLKKCFSQIFVQFGQGLLYYAGFEVTRVISQAQLI